MAWRRPSAQTCCMSVSCELCVALRGGATRCTCLWCTRQQAPVDQHLRGTALARHWPGMALARHGTGPERHWPGAALARSGTGPERHWPAAFVENSRLAMRVGNPYAVTGSILRVCHLRATLRRDEPTDARLLRERRHLRRNQNARPGLGSLAGSGTRRCKARAARCRPAGTKEQPLALFRPLPPPLHPPPPLPYVLYPISPPARSLLHAMPRSSLSCHGMTTNCSLSRCCSLAALQARPPAQAPMQRWARTAPVVRYSPL